jgi:hypothetical protein
MSNPNVTCRAYVCRSIFHQPIAVRKVGQLFTARHGSLSTLGHARSDQSEATDRDKLRLNAELQIRVYERD